MGIVQDVRKGNEQISDRRICHTDFVLLVVINLLLASPSEAATYSL